MIEERITRDIMFVKILLAIAQRGTCGRARVGCVITLNNRIISTGYNGSLPEEPECSELCNLKTKCEKTIHAEMNAILAAAKEGIALNTTTLYCTFSPCLQCARSIIQVGIQEVVYLNEYRDDYPLELLRRNKIKVRSVYEV